MRERGLNPVACLEIETLAASALVATSLQDASGHRAQKLKQVLQYLSSESGEGRWQQMPRDAPNDPLAALKAMTDEERIALFTCRTKRARTWRP
jgi:hypothetical protein